MTELKKPVPAPPETQTNTMGVVGVSISIASIILGCLAPVGAIVSLLGISKKPNGLAIAGLVISFVSCILWGVVAVVIAFSMFAVANLEQTSLQITAYMEAKTLEQACKMYKLNVDSFPTTLDDLYEKPDNLTREKWGGPYLDAPVSSDPWQTPYDYQADEANDRVIITSAGPDQRIGTPDDIASEF